ncbi:hydroxylase [Streptosporangium violaceochromogenes]|nr:hydroxylase [Streptosporangium violaceochromogenes]
MSERSDHEAGSPCWAELSSTDVTLSVRFYREIFGWEAVFDPRPGAGGHGRFTLEGKDVAGVGPNPGDGGFPAWSTAWTVRVAVRDVEGVAERVPHAGGKVVLGPVRDAEGGVVALLQDPSGALLSAGRPGGREGARGAGEPGTFAWSELVTGDTGACEEFYRSVLGWEARPGERGGTPYTEWWLNGRPVAGMTRPEPWLPRRAPSHWRACFAVADVGAAVARACELGGVSAWHARDADPPRAVVSDPQSAFFGLVGAGHAR